MLRPRRRAFFRRHYAIRHYAAAYAACFRAMPDADAAAAAADTMPRLLIFAAADAIDAISHFSHLRY